MLVLLPLVFRSGTALTVMSLMGISVIFALSYNMLLGQTGMLSFGHAVYYGLGAYFTVHAHQRGHRRQAADPASRHAAGRRAGGLGVCHAVRLGLDPAQRNGLRHDLAGVGGAGRIELA